MFSRLKALTRIVFGGKPFLWSYLLPRTKIDYGKEVGDGLGSSVVMAPILWIARTFPEAPIALEKDGEMEDDHDMLDLIRKPNSFYSGHILSMATIISFSMQGNSYWLKLRNNQGKVIELWWVPHWMMTPKWPDDGSQFISHYEYKPLDDKIRVEVEDVVHFRYGLDPRNIRLGLAPLGSLFREIFTDDEAANFVAVLLKNAGVPGVVISPDSDDAAILPKDARAVKRYFKKRVTGDNRGEPIVMPTKTKIESFGFSPKDLDLSRLREIPEERVTAILGIPAAVVGFGTGLQQTKVGATMKEMREMAYENCIVPMQRLIASEVENNLLPDFEDNTDYKVIYDLTKVRVLQEDENKKALRQNIMIKGGWIKVSEARKVMGLDVDPEHEIYLRPFSVTAVPAGTGPPVILEPVESEEPTEPVIPEEDGNGKAKVKFFAPVDMKEFGQELAIQFYKDWRHLSKLMAKDLGKVFEALGQAAADAWRQVAEEQGITELVSSNIPKTKDEVTEDDILTDIIMAAMAIVVLDYSVSYLRAAKLTYKTINGITDLGVEFTQAAEMRILAAGGTRLGLVDLTEQSRAAVFQALQEARRLGEDFSAAARRVSQHVSRGRYLTPETRSQIIARTEMKYAQNMASLEAYHEGGIERVQIIDGQMATSCDFCIERDGQIITVAEAEALWEHPNGTLSFAPIVRRT